MKTVADDVNPSFNRMVNNIIATINCLRNFSHTLFVLNEDVFIFLDIQFHLFFFSFFLLIINLINIINNQYKLTN